MNRIEQIELEQETLHKSEWQLFKANQEIATILAQQSNMQIALFDQRKQMLKIMAENDALKVRELKDRKKIRFLLSASTTEQETTYFKDNLSKKIIRISATQEQAGKDEKDLVIMQDEIEALKLELFSAKTQLEEQVGFIHII